MPDRAGEDLDVLIVGAGFAGLYAVYRFGKQALRVRCLEAEDGVGGVWRRNCYPGARCDVRSIDYSYSFSPELHQEWRWTEHYASQPEILRYAEHVAERFDLTRHITFDTRVTSAQWLETTGRWAIETNAGERINSRFLVLATGALSCPKDPGIPGLGDFKGEAYFTSRWPRSPVSFRDKRVGVIGTGSSAIQAIPEIAKEAAQLTVFQRTPGFSMPARNGPIEEAEYAAVRARYEDYRAEVRAGWSGLASFGGDKPAAAYTPDERESLLEAAWARGGLGVSAVFTDCLVNQEANDVAADFIRGKIRSLVRNPTTAAKLCPWDHPVATRRPCLDSGYFETFNRPTVRLVDLREDPIDAIVETGIRTRSREHPLDMIVFATGFDAFTGPIRAIDIRNAAGEQLMDRWMDGPRTYLGMAVDGFPNLFIVTGPGSPSVLANVIMAAELDVDWIADCIAWLDARGRRRIEARPEAVAEWTAHVAEVAERTLYPKADSWYMGANIPGKPRTFLPYVGGLGNFVAITRREAQAGYPGFNLREPT